MMEFSEADQIKQISKLKKAQEKSINASLYEFLEQQNMHTSMQAKTPDQVTFQRLNRKMYKVDRRRREGRI